MAYGFGDVAGVPVLIVVFVSVFDSAGEDLSMTVVLLSVLFSPGGTTVVSFFSQAAKKASASKMQMYFMLLSYSL